jgi:uncharacterized protein (DUF427 family)
MVRAVWNGTIIAECPSEAVKTVEGNVYFPPSALDRRYLRPSKRITTCAWKGRANYYDVIVDGKENLHAAWYYANPTDAAQNITGYVAFWQGVEVKA